MWDKRAEYLDHKDADTVKMVLDQGFGDTKLVTLRLLGVEIPADGVGIEACKDFVTEWFNTTNPKGYRWGWIATTVQLKNGEYVGVITDATVSSNLNAELSQFIHDGAFVEK